MNYNESKVFLTLKVIYFEQLIFIVSTRYPWYFFNDFLIWQLCAFYV